MARDLWPKARRSSGANQRALRSVSGRILLVLSVTTGLLTATLRRALGGHHDPDQVGCVPGAELLHDVRPMIFDCARADAERAAGLLVRRAGSELLQHFTLAPRQRFPARKMQRGDRRGGILLLPPLVCANRFIQPLDDFASAKRLFDEIERA